jgi:hypothetical protein
MTALWLHERADRFWADAGGAPPAFPRDLREAVSSALPVAIIDLADLSIARVDGWLAAHGIVGRLTVPDRALHACTVISPGGGLIFLDADDSAEERRFSLAHEVAHYLVEYAVPREETGARLGEDIVAVLDGRRSPSSDERIGALLAGVSLVPNLHVMERTPDGHLPEREISVAERQADDLAFELLAPSDEVRTGLPAGSSRLAFEAVLRQRYGLPAVLAAAYARKLAPSLPAAGLFQQLFRGR